MLLVAGPFFVGNGVHSVEHVFRATNVPVLCCLAQTRRGCWVPYNIIGTFVARGRFTV